MDSEIPFNEGDILTIDNDIITFNGNVIFSKGDKVTIRKVLIRNNRSADKVELLGFNLEEESGAWHPRTFEETKDFE